MSLQKEVNKIPKNILVAPLNWGLGHATRCIPIIKALQEGDYTPIIASDGIALAMLRKEFPDVQTLELPSYQVEYSKKGSDFKWKMLLNTPKMLKAIWSEKKMVASWINKYKIDGIISDNRLGVFNENIPSVYITHQLNVMSGSTTWLTSKLHQKSIKKFTECWVPDVAGEPNLAGELSHSKELAFTPKYLGSLSRMHKKDAAKQYDLMIVLSGPDPQRGMLESILKTELKHYEGKVVFIKGIVEEEQKKEKIESITYFNFMTSLQLQQTFNESNLVLARSGFTTIMDLAKLGKKAFFIPTPGQYEQMYLARKLKKDGIAPYSEQDDFKIEDLIETKQYSGFADFENIPNWEKLFEVFEI
ncbi:glycosyltransferase [Flavobacterium hiemivividum]|uniref:Glycosyltransferase n=1 Tax=Flavobacterium hiemivividum TaxID=2541734 RepID=A0A4R5D8G9_9FLAO|nr:glycosyltransferase [Flavobacterium hiemivividum]TDE06483.1 glycosyltransferase [Flavobacterium hiemivividum]